MNKDSFEKQSEQDQRYIRRFSVINYEPVLSAFANYQQSTYDIDFFICFQNRAKWKATTIYRIKAQSQLNLFAIL